MKPEKTTRSIIAVVFRSQSRWKWTVRFLSSLCLLAICVLPLYAEEDNSLQTGIKLFEEGKYSQAEEILRSIVDQEPQNASAYFYLGRIYYERKDYSPAIKRLEKATELEDNNADHHFWLAAACGRKAQNTSIFKKPGLAKRTKYEFERAIELNPDHVRAREGFVRFLVKAPGVMGGSNEEAYLQAEEIKKRDPIWAHKAYARIYMDEENYEKASQEYYAAIEEDPTDPELYYLLKDLYVESENSEKAFSTLEELLVKFPEEMEAYYDIGAIGAAQGFNLDRGIQCLNRYLQAEPAEDRPSPSWAHYQLGMIYEHTDKLDSARVHYESALALDSNNKEAKKALKKLE